MIDEEDFGFLTKENKSLRVALPQTALFALAQRIVALTDPPPKT